MADATGKLKWSISLTPIETLSDAETNKIDIASSTCYGTVSGSGTVGDSTNAVTIDDTGDATSGYINGVKQYKSVASAADATGAAFTALAIGGTSTNEEGIWIKNSGYQHSSVTATSSTANAATTFLIVRAIASQSATTTIASTTELASGDEPIIAVLAAGEGIFLPLRKTMLAEKFSLASSTVDLSNGNITASGETIAAEILVF